MANITAKELTALEDQLNYEMVLVKKYRTLAGQSTDAEIKTKYSQIASKHQEHFNRLYSYLQ
jgi:rubrerythrin